MTVFAPRDKTHDVRLRRGRRLWDLASRTVYGIVDRLCAPVRELALQHLDVQVGDSVLDLGCGIGAPPSRRLRDAVGAHGRVVGVDYSPRMLVTAGRR